MTCNHEAPSVEEAAQRWAGEARFVGVAWTGTDAEFQGFVDRHGLTFPQISDDAADVFARFGVAAQPALAVVAPDGEVETVFGAAEPELVDRMIEDALAG